MGKIREVLPVVCTKFLIKNVSSYYITKTFNPPTETSNAIMIDFMGIIRKLAAVELREAKSFEELFELLM